MPEPTAAPAVSEDELIARWSTAEGRLTIEEYEGHRVLIADGVILSVALGAEDPPFGYWTAMLPEAAPTSALLLGLGAGTLAHLLTRRYPEVRITGVDADRQVVEFAQRHFDLSLPNLTIVLADAFEYVRGADRRFDYVAVDLFCGRTLPREILARPFLRRLQTIAGPGGEVAFNLFRDRRSHQHLARIGRILPVARTEWLPGNVVAHCRIHDFA